MSTGRASACAIGRPATRLLAGRPGCLLDAAASRHLHPRERGAVHGLRRDRTDQTLACWRITENERTRQAGTFASVSVAGFDSCAIRTDGTLACWGLTTSTPPGTYSAVSARDHSSCGIRTDGTLACWRRRRPRQPGPSRRSVSGESGSALRADHTLACRTSPGIRPGHRHLPAVRHLLGRDIRPRPAAARSGRTGGSPAGVAREPAEIVPGPAASSQSRDWRTGTRCAAVEREPSARLVPPFDVRYARRPWTPAGCRWVRSDDGNGGGPTTTFEARPAPGYCFSVRARDVDGVVSPGRIVARAARSTIARWALG